MVVLVIALAIADLVTVVEQDDTASSWENRLQSYRNRLVEAIPLTAIKIVLVAWQIITQVCRNTRVWINRSRRRPRSYKCVSYRN